MNNLKYLNNDKQSLILKFLRKHEEMFELLEGAKPYYAKSFPIPKIHKETSKTEVNRLINIGELKREKKLQVSSSNFNNS